MSTKQAQKVQPIDKTIFSLHRLLITPSYLGTTVRALFIFVLFLAAMVLPLLPFTSDGGAVLLQVSLLLVLFFAVAIVYDALYITIVKAHTITYKFDRWYLIVAECASLLWFIVSSFIDTSQNKVNVVGMWLFTLLIVVPLIRVMLVLLPHKKAR
jgi:hypothetical protein